MSVLPPPLPSPPLLLPRRLTFSTTRYSTRDVPRHIPRISRDTRYCRRKYDPPRDCRRRRRCCRVVPQARRYHPRLCPAFGSRVSRRNRGGVDEVGNSTRARWEEEFLSSGYSGLSDSSVESPASPSCPGQGPRASSGPRCHASGPHGVGAARLSLPSLSFSPRTNERRWTSAISYGCIFLVFAEAERSGRTVRNALPAGRSAGCGKMRRRAEACTATSRPLRRLDLPSGRRASLAGKCDPRNILLFSDPSLRRKHIAISPDPVPHSHA